MNSKEREVEPQMERQLQMIEDHLGLATPAQREQLARLLEQDSELKARYQAVTATLDELDKYSVNVPDGLADRIISAVKMDNLISDQASQRAIETH